MTAAITLGVSATARPRPATKQPGFRSRDGGFHRSVREYSPRRRGPGRSRALASRRWGEAAEGERVARGRNRRWAADRCGRGLPVGASAASATLTMPARRRTRVRNEPRPVRTRTATMASGQRRTPPGFTSLGSADNRSAAVRLRRLRACVRAKTARTGPGVDGRVCMSTNDQGSVVAARPPVSHVSMEQRAECCRGKPLPGIRVPTSRPATDGTEELGPPVRRQRGPGVAVDATGVNVTETTEGVLPDQVNAGPTTCFRRRSHGWV